MCKNIQHRHNHDDKNCHRARNSCIHAWCYTPPLQRRARTQLNWDWGNTHIRATQIGQPNPDGDNLEWDNWSSLQQEWNFPVHLQCSGNFLSNMTKIEAPSKCEEFAVNVEVMTPIWVLQQFRPFQILKFIAKTIWMWFSVPSLGIRPSHWAPLWAADKKLPRQKASKPSSPPPTSTACLRNSWLLTARELYFIVVTLQVLFQRKTY